MKFVSYYTPLYSMEAEGLIRSFEKLGIKNYQVEQRPQAGGWARNTQVKASFIYEKLQENDAVVWTDADSRVRQIPTLFDTIDSDVGFFYLPPSSFVLPDHSILHRCDDWQLNGYLQSGTMYFRKNERTLKLLELWMNMNDKDFQQWDQWTLQYATTLVHNLTVHKLPSEYVWVDGTNQQFFGNRRPVIEHLQASRKYKKMLG